MLIVSYWIKSVVFDNKRFLYSILNTKIIDLPNVFGLARAEKEIENKVKWKNVKGGEIKNWLAKDRKREREREMVMVRNGDREIFETDKTETVWTKSVCERLRWKKIDRLSVDLDKFL